ncbi:3-oxoadipate enol-lactonase [Micromonospora echinaurantiaca]|uniref:3-oxoadipate enol-lactonase n=1 Tax=Micromonospora echinaurantiaca TaxID=47857 RepID=A0A1C5I3Q0_9ACTN|nr:3-oxoadipate enol-lactonase [Micromonospora echinaurantiaca]SCG52803.1 3-oxoadipate enol-lactonase [Micromonospora echinaurantiaca]
MSNPAQPHRPVHREQEEHVPNVAYPVHDLTDRSTVDVHAVVEGPEDAPVVVMSPSLGSTHAMWEPQAIALRARFRVVRYDHRGHGRSPVPPGPYELADLGADVLRLLDRLGISSAHFCGLSLGGMTGMWLAAHAPERVRRLVLCCTSARLGPPRFWAERADLVRREGVEAVADGVVTRWFTPGWAQAHPETARDMRAMVAATPAEGYASCCNAIQSMDLTDLLPRIRAKTLVIAGHEDPSTPPEHGRAIAASIPNARLEVLSPAAHLANVEQRQAVTALLLEHLLDEK